MSKGKKPANWRSRNQITQEVQVGLRQKGITINSRKTVGNSLGNAFTEAYFKAELGWIPTNGGIK